MPYSLSHAGKGSPPQSSTAPAGGAQPQDLLPERTQLTAVFYNGSLYRTLEALFTFVPAATSNVVNSRGELRERERAHTHIYIYSHQSIHTYIHRHIYISEPRKYGSLGWASIYIYTDRCFAMLSFVHHACPAPEEVVAAGRGLESQPAPGQQHRVLRPIR